MTGTLNRTLGIVAIIAFGLTNEIASGLFFVSTQIQKTAPGVGTLVPLLMIVGGLITFLTVVAYRYFFASGLVGAGGEYVIISRSVSPSVGFVATFLAWFGLTGSLGSLAYTAPTFLATAAASIGLTSTSKFLSSSIGILIVGLIIIWGIWLIHVRGIRLAGVLAVISMCVVLFVSALLIITGFATSQSALANAVAAHLHLSVSSILAAAPVHEVSLSAAFGTALPVLFFGYLGLSTATQTGGEAVDAKRSLPKAVLITVSVVTVVYTLFAFAVYHAVPWQLIAGLSELGFNQYTTSSGVLQFVMPHWLSALVNLLVAFIVIKTLLPIFLAQSRWIFAWSQDGILPPAFRKTHQKYQTPVLGLTISSIFGTISLVESLKLGYVFGVNLRVLSVMIVFLAMGIGLLYFPKRVPHLYEQNQSLLGRNRGLQICLGTVLIVISVWFIISIAYSSRSDAFILQPFVQAVIVAIVALLVYGVYRRRLAKVSADERDLIAKRFSEAPPQ
ncbi:APC family permease [Alicyclobacillus fructus]|uniref:APC family permease n=1 Tax=Alicyclobacillus fructus TaxID=2816082 RepID=UPI001A8E49AE|nr:APC family permease [Alicyclobacillus fructus]